MFRKDEINCARRYNGGKGNLTFWYFPSSIRVVVSSIKLVPSSLSRSTILRSSLPLSFLWKVVFSFFFENLSETISRTKERALSFLFFLSASVFWQTRGLIDASNCLHLYVETLFFSDWLIRTARFCQRRVSEEKRLQKSYKNPKAELRSVCVS